MTLKGDPVEIDLANYERELDRAVREQEAKENSLDDFLDWIVNDIEEENPAIYDFLDEWDMLDVYVEKFIERNPDHWKWRDLAGLD